MIFIITCAKDDSHDGAEDAERFVRLSSQGLLFDIVVLLGCAVIFVPVIQKLGLGSVLGYLIAGLAIGPWGLRGITETDHIAHVSEFGVVFLLFIIGLELDPKRLWGWKVQIFGMGLAQMIAVTAVVTGAVMLFGSSWQVGFVIGAGLSLSSTAIASQILRERNLMATPGGSSAFSILLFQDIAVIPLLSILPLLTGGHDSEPHLPFWQTLLVIAVVIALGRHVIRFALRLVASVHQRDLFTALSLLIVVGLAALMQFFGVSMALGAFIGGLLLANSEYRHAIETDIEPFKGLLLGLFFMSVGMTVDLGTLIANPLLTIGAVIGVVALKIALHSALAWAFRLSRKEIPLFSILLSQVGEFAFVLFALAAGDGLFSRETGALLAAIVAISMATTPLCLKLYDRWIAPRLARQGREIDETINNDDPEVIIAGFGRVGQIVGRLLYANRIRATVLDHDPDQIELLKPFGFKVYYGDATRLDLLEAAGLRTAKLLVIAIDDVDDNLTLARLAKEQFPNVRIIARARNVGHASRLMELGIHIWERETFDSSLRLGTEALKVLGWSPYQAARAGLKFREHNLKMVSDLAAQRGDRATQISVAKQARDDLARMFEGEEQSRRQQDEGWEPSAGD